MINAKSLKIDGVDFAVEYCEVNANAAPIINMLETEKCGYVCWEPGAITSEIECFGMSPLPVSKSGFYDLGLSVGGAQFSGRFQLNKHTDLGVLQRYKFIRHGAMSVEQLCES